MGSLARWKGVICLSAQPSVHPAWCIGVDCGANGIHESAPITASQPGDLVGVDAARMRLGDGPDVVRVSLTDEDVTTTYSLLHGQARALSEAIIDLLAT